eukprot:CAMPEP_0184280428 /NCGR_PEP_ID=MMETSP0977-20130417/58575_1 /TAXON_ID=483370 /ORGANISM="non described non described, Strain CCMP2097" /LENGTH=64 /DNA_ID=CAMNT_0026586397 /DNA_START=11 /DNA_END=202 /DNA_ORIENTATION=-
MDVHGAPAASAAVIAASVLISETAPPSPPAQASTAGPNASISSHSRHPEQSQVAMATWRYSFVS